MPQTTWGGQKIGGYYWPFNFLIFWCFFVILALCFPKLAFGTSKIEILRSKSVWGQILMQIRQKFNDFLAFYEFVMIFSRMARCLVFVDLIFCPPPYNLLLLHWSTESSCPAPQTARQGHCRVKALDGQTVQLPRLMVRLRLVYLRFKQNCPLPLLDIFSRAVYMIFDIFFLALWYTFDAVMDGGCH